MPDFVGSLSKDRVACFWLIFIFQFLRTCPRDSKRPLRGNIWDLKSANFPTDCSVSSCQQPVNTPKELSDWLSMVLHLHQHNIGYTADGFYRSDDPTNSVKALKEGG